MRHPADPARARLAPSGARSARRSAPPGRARPRASSRCRRPARSRSPRRSRAPPRWPAPPRPGPRRAGGCGRANWSANCSSTSAPMSRATWTWRVARACQASASHSSSAAIAPAREPGEPEPAADVVVDLQREHGVQRAPERRRGRGVALRHPDRERVDQEIHGPRRLRAGRRGPRGLGRLPQARPARPTSPRRAP